VAAQADALISGDRDLTDLQDAPVPVLTPRTFLIRLGEST
jgi:predicted nucleic acid-binding protein